MYVTSYGAVCIPRPTAAQTTYHVAANSGPVYCMVLFHFDCYGAHFRIKYWSCLCWP